MNYLKISKATDLSGTDRKIYRALEIFPGFLSWTTLLSLLILSYFQPVWVAYFIIAFDVYWLLRVVYLAIHLIASYRRLKNNVKIDWRAKCEEIKNWEDIIHLIILPTYNEELEVIRATFKALMNDGYPADKMIVVLAIEGRAGEPARRRAAEIKNEFGAKFRNFLITAHPGDIAGEIKGKGANQSWAGRQVKKEIIDKENLDYDKIIVSVFDIDTCVIPGYFHCLTHKFLTVAKPHRASYQPIPVYHNNLWQAPFFARTTAISNTFWQMMQQIRQERLATYSSHAMSWRALVEIDFWSTNMVSEDSRIFWHCLSFYHGDYRVEPLNFPVSMDVCMDKSRLKTLKNLYKQQRRWGWGVENIPFVIFNFFKDKSKQFRRRKKLFYIFMQIEGFHSWATNALIIAVIGWMPMVLGGDRFNATVLSSNLPSVTRILMTMAMLGMVVSAIVSTLLLPKRPPQYGFFKTAKMVLQWAFLPLTIIFFGAIPGLEAQTRLMLGKYMGFWVTPKAR
ncbi:glycosyltransferase family 2 protein [Candidatus Parcubacteria bacterium]|nr:glycosyltransferase family 2 protein [Candidatus Parcubacteria bacterium]MCG2701203.1 glycosyltransferase family 2 protein [Candidatus Parcubacteria bacterium]